MTPPLSREGLERQAASAGFDPTTYERVLRLLTLLDRMSADTELAPHFVLKGGTALNLFVFTGVPRLSVDIDLNYIGSADLDGMRDARPALEDRLSRLCQSLGLTPRRVATGHAGGKWILPYRNALGTMDRVEIDLNYVLRVPLWEVQIRESVALGTVRARNVAVLDEHELAGAKLVALLTRTASRDLFDAHHLLFTRSLDLKRLRLVTVVYGAMSNVDWRTVTIDQVSADADDIRQKLLPVLRAHARRDAHHDPQWAQRLADETRTGLSAILPLAPPERDFITLVREHSEIRAQLITDDPELQQRIETQPMLRWRAQQRGTVPAPDEATG